MNPIIDAEKANEGLRIVRHLEPKYRITEVENPAYRKVKRERQAFSPQPGSIRQSTAPAQPSLGDQIRQREKRYTVKLLSTVCDICQCCPELEDCAWSCEVRAIDMCERVKRNLIYMGVVEG